MAKKVLFLVTGMTPQIITETVWALACDPENEEKWIPDEIYVMSTEDGLNQIRKRLFEDGVFLQFQQDYPQLAQVQFSTDSLHAIKNQAGQVLTDLKTPEDNQLAGDSICSIIQDFTKDDNVSLHVSIAGGRKTMGFYAGYALSLYGRAQDRMSHVLVEDKFEPVNDFFYPTPETHYVTNRDGKVLDAKEALVWLANVEFVRMKDAIKDKHQLKGEDSFSQVVNKINESFNDVVLKINLHKRTVQVNDKFLIKDLSPREFAMLHWFADRRKQGLGGIVAPRVNASSTKKISEDERLYLQKLTQDFKPYYEAFKNTDDIIFDVDSKFFESVKSHLKSSLETNLGLELAAKIAIKQEKKGQPFHLDLPADAIEIIDTFQD